MSWRVRCYVGVQKLLARLGLHLPGKIMYIGGSDTLPPPLSRDCLLYTSPSPRDRG